MDSSGIASGGGMRAQLLGREYVDDWIKKKPPMSWFCMIFAFYEVSRHNNHCEYVSNIVCVYIHIHTYTYVYVHILYVACRFSKIRVF